MTEEEKEAIQILDNDNWEYLEFMDEDEEYEKLKKSIEIIVKLAKKLQKENEKLKKQVIKRDNDIIYLEETAEKEFLTKQEVKENYISKDKIRKLLEVE